MQDSGLSGRGWSQHGCMALSVSGTAISKAGFLLRRFQACVDGLIIKLIFFFFQPISEKAIPSLYGSAPALIHRNLALFSAPGIRTRHPDKYP